MKNTVLLIIAVFTAGSIFGQKTALNFDGLDDYIPVNSTTKLNSMSKITIETWLYVKDFSSAPCTNCWPIVWNQQNSYRFGTGSSGTIEFIVLNGSTNVTITSKGALSTNAWHHIAGTFDGTKIKLYVDGAATDSATYSAFSISYASTSSDVWIADPKTGFGGTLEETRIWDYARTAAQIYEGTFKRFNSSQAGLVLQFSYEDGIAFKDNTSVSSIKDYSSYGNTGTATDFAMMDSVSNFVIGRSYCDTVAYAKFSVTKCNKYILPSKKRTITVSGVYQDTISSWRGCDSVMTITAKINKQSSSSMSLANCDSVQNPVSKKYYKVSGKYTLTIPNFSGCDSIISFNVTVYKKDTTTFNYDACNSVQLNNGNIVSAGGVYKDVLKGFRGCDSIILHNVKIRKPTYSKANLKVCTFVFCPSNNSKVFTSPGIYYDTTINSQNCDSIIEYTVTSKSTSSNINVKSCGNYLSPSKKYTWNKSGTYQDTLLFLNSQGCDSFLTINLTIPVAVKQTLNVAECKSYTVPSGSKVVTSTGTVNDVIKSKSGCDSIQYTINVTINTANTAFVRSNNTLTATAAGGASFQWLDCNKNNESIAGETNRDFTPKSQGKYSLEVKENNCKDTSNCVDFAFNNLSGIQLNNVLISPNPSHGLVQIQSDITLHHVKITVVNLLGETIQAWEMDELNTYQLHLNLAPSVNFIRIESAEGFVVKCIIID